MPASPQTLPPTVGDLGLHSSELLPARLNVLFLVSPGRECASCLRIAATWREALEGWPAHEVQVGFVLVADLQQAETWEPRLREGAGSARVWKDPGNEFRRHFGLEDGPLIVGVSKRGRVKFSIPMTLDFWERVSFEKEFIQVLVRESIKS